MKLLLPVCLALLFSCGNKNGKLEKGFEIGSMPRNESVESTHDHESTPDSIKGLVQPNNVILTGIKGIRFVPVFKLNLDRRNERTWFGSPDYVYNSYSEDIDVYNDGQNWNQHIVPGFEIVGGYNLVNLSIVNLDSGTTKPLFKNPSLIRYVYYPTTQADTLNHMPVFRNYFMVSVYEDDTNKDGFLDTKDLRRLYYFSANGGLKSMLPAHYSSERLVYDHLMDWMYVYARYDANKDGQRSELEPTHVWGFNLKNPLNPMRMY